jgi:hypothetical protein
MWSATKSALCKMHCRAFNLFDFCVFYYIIGFRRILMNAHKQGERAGAVMALIVAVIAALTLFEVYITIQHPFVMEMIDRW